MKKFALLLSLLTSCLVFAACSSVKGNSPEAFMARLRKAEKQNDGNGEHVFSTDCTMGIQYYMEERGMQPFCPYIEALVKSPLSDEQKIEKQFVVIPYWQSIADCPQHEKDEVIQQMNKDLIYSYFHVVNRLFYAAALHAGCNLKIKRGRHLFFEIVDRDDMSLMRLALQKGVKQKKIDEALRFVHSHQALELLENHGANVQRENMRGVENCLLTGLVRYASQARKDEHLIFLYFLDQVLSDGSVDSKFGNLCFSLLALVFHERDPYGFYLKENTERAKVIIKGLLEKGFVFDKNKLRGQYIDQSFDDIIRIVDLCMQKIGNVAHALHVRECMGRLPQARMYMQHIQRSRIEQEK
jgi:hypothetical protein